MRELIATVTRKGQVTVPITLRRAWHLKEGDQLAFIIDDDEVRLSPRGVVAATAGVLKPYRQERPPTVDDIREAVEESIAEDVTGNASH